jgi:hypothetical protein
MLTRLYMGAAVFAAIGVLAFGFMKHSEQKGARNAVAKIEKRTDKRVAKAGAAQRRVDPGSSEQRLRDRYCGNC